MASALDKSAANNQDIALLISRILIGILFLVAGYNQARGLSGFTGYIGRLGVPVPGVLAPAAMIFHFVAAIALFVGYQTRLFALLSGLFCIVAALIAHTKFGDANQLNHFLKNIGIAGGALALFVAGPGAYSIDAKR